ncbi:MAG TPA: hypothetical protein VIL35_01205 [Vicinamibacterales bacterium]
MVEALLVLLVYVLHQDFWFWREARPLVFGILPVGLAYHAAYTLVVPLLMSILIRRAWPAHLEDEQHARDVQPTREPGSGRTGAAR